MFPLPRRRWFGAFSVVLASACPWACAQSLPDLHRAALDRDPAVLAAQAALRAAEQRVVQADAGLGPTASVTGTRTETQYKEAPRFSTRPFDATQATLQITQPLLAGARHAAVDAADAQFAQSQAALREATSESSQRLVEAAFSLLLARDALQLVQAQAVEAAEQLKAARRSYQVGTATVTDLREAEAQTDRIEADRIGAAADLDLRQQVLAELTGATAPALLQRGLAGDTLPPLPPASVLDWLAAAQDGSATLRQARLALQGAEAEVRRAWQGHAPTVDLTYTYTMSKDTGTVTSIFPRRGDSSAFGLNVTVPLFASGATQARVREAQALRDKAEADVETARRNVVLGVRQQFSAALSAIGRARGLETAVRSQELAVRANRRGYEVGMKVNAEVLTAQSRWFEARRDLARARYEAWLAWARLQGLAGTLDDGVIQRLDGLLIDMKMAQP
ncbi:MAG: TolC family outer membrane protein [Rubrivivax sp.]|nr:TolC family outer membrane protein [Rubrivivax sp.]